MITEPTGPNFYYQKALAYKETFEEIQKDYRQSQKSEIVETATGTVKW